MAEGAKQKVIHHGERLAFWTEVKARVMAEIKETGIEVSETEAGGSYTSSGRAPQVMVRNDLQTRLTECHQKIMEHARKVAEYAGWVEVLEGTPAGMLTLNADDYLYFFGKK